MGSAGKAQGPGVARRKKIQPWRPDRGGAAVLWAVATPRVDGKIIKRARDVD
jgi:hypothetical protein